MKSPTESPYQKIEREVNAVRQPCDPRELGM